MKILILCDHYPLSPRVIKVRNSILEMIKNTEVIVFCWNRKNIDITEDYVVSHNRKSEYGNFLKTALGLVSFIKAARIYIRRYNPDFIHAIDLPMLLTTFGFSDKHKIVYEVYDIKALNHKVFNKARELVEGFYVRKVVSKLIFASPYFHIYYNEVLKNKKTYININNKPNKNIKLYNTDYMLPYKEKLQGNMVIGFIGNIRHKELLVNLIRAIESIDEVVVLLAGDGLAVKEIKNKIQNITVKKNVIFTGRFKSEDLQSIYSCCDYIWAAYPTKDINVKYAVSNKFYESIVFCKKIIVSKDTYLSEDVIRENRGYVVNPYDIEDITKVILRLKQNYGKECFNHSERIYWETEAEQLKDIYIRLSC